MLNLAFTKSAVDAFNQKFLDDALPPELSRQAFAAFDPTRYDPRSLAIGLNAWQLRTLDEYRSQVAFTELLGELTQIGYAVDVLGTAVRVVRDEARHVELCRRMVTALGGGNVIPGQPNWVRSDTRLPLQLRVIRTVVGSLCIGETFSVRMLAGVRDNAFDPLARAVMTCLAADESIHSRFGWVLLELLAPHLSAVEREDLVRTLPFYLAAAEAAMVPATAKVEDAPLLVGPSHPFGSLAPRARAEIFYETLERDVLRRFEAMGFPARKAWAERAKT
jgi:hypothetical protein